MFSCSLAKFLSIALAAGLFPISVCHAQRQEAELPLPAAAGLSAMGACGEEAGEEGVIIAFGDSLTAGEVRPTYPEVLARLTGKTVVNDGIGGSTAESGVSRSLDAIAGRNGTHMLVLYGINDLLYGHPVPEIADSIFRIVENCTRRGVVPVLATYPIPIHSHARFAPDAHRLNDAIRGLAHARRVRLADLERRFMKDGKPDPGLYLEDGLHPSAAGNKAIAHAFAVCLEPVGPGVSRKVPVAGHGQR